MSRNAKQVVKDSTAVGLVATSAGLFVLRACRQDRALARAGRNTLNGAALATPLAAALGFLDAKASKKIADREEALEETATCGAIGAIGGGALGGLVSLAWDAFRA